MSALVLVVVAACSSSSGGRAGDGLPQADPRVTVGPGTQSAAPHLDAVGTPVVTGGGQVVTVDAADGESVLGLTSELPVEVDVVHRAGGALYPVVGPLGSPGLLFPPFSPGDDPARAVVRVVPTDGVGTDPLAPGRADFTIGADFAVDARSQGSTVDTGNNLLQRGLASDASQYKIEVDNLRPSCRIQGSEGVVELRVEAGLLPDRWYRVRCSRSGETIELTVSTLRGGTPREAERVEAQGATGDLHWSDGTPLSVGGKLAANGSMIRSNTDQFNGLIAMPVLQIDD